MSATIPTMTPAEFARHLARARQDGVTVVKLSARREDLGRVKSGHRVYEASLQGCTCQAGQAGTFCKHRALVLEMTGHADEVAPGYYEAAGGGDVAPPVEDATTAEAAPQEGGPSRRGPWFAWEVWNGWTVYAVSGQVYGGAPRLNVPGGCYRTRAEAEALADRLNARDPEAFDLLDSKTRRRWL